MSVLELFEKRLELIHEHPTWIEYRCPICKHSGLKINKTTGYYSNYKCNCNIKQITAIVFQGVSDFLYKRKPKEPPKIIPEVANLKNVRLSKLPEDRTNVYTSTNLLDLNRKYGDLENSFVYLYSKTQRTKRINRIKSTGKKVVIPQVFTNGSWINGIGEETFPLFTNEKNLQGELVLVVEGEKCVEFLNCIGIEAISILASYATSIERIQKSIEVSRKCIPNVKQFLYIPDLDSRGIKKAIIFQQAMWDINLPCKIFDLRSSLVKSTNFVSGYDIADYIIENGEISLIEVFENEFR